MVLFYYGKPQRNDDDDDDDDHDDDHDDYHNNDGGDDHGSRSHDFVSLDTKPCQLSNKINNSRNIEFFNSDFQTKHPMRSSVVVIDNLPWYFPGLILLTMIY